MPVYVYTFTNAIPIDGLLALFAQTEWTAKRSANDIQTLLKGTCVCLGVWDGDQLVGFARAITDDLTRAYVEDVIVDSAYRGGGIGAELMRRLLARLDHVEEITLNCHDPLIPFYERLGFGRAGMAYMHIWKGG